MLAQLDVIAAARAMGPIVGAHQARVVEEAVGEQQIDRALAQVPRWRAIAARLVAGQAGDGIVAAQEIRIPFPPRLLRPWDAAQTVVSHFMPAGESRFERP